MSVFRKYVADTDPSAESQMALQVRDFLQQRHTAYVPDVLNVDAARGFIDFEEIHNAVPLAECVHDTDKRGIAFKLAASFLADFHTNFSAPEIVRSKVLDGLNDSPQSFLHGDFTVDNVLYRLDQGDIAVVDWSTAPWVHEAANFGPTYWDVCWMVLSIFALHPFKLGGAGRREAARLFLESYCSASPSAEVEPICRYAEAIGDWASSAMDVHLRLSRPVMKYGILQFRKFFREFGYDTGN